ncbi:MAG TPA: HAD family hydrolase [Patescibacteria group bacterium]|nr:HAD family hydrolase [Patescibacteria group bacterium]
MRKPFVVSRRALLAGLGAFSAAAFVGPLPLRAQGSDPLPSWNEGPAKNSILDFVRATTNPGDPKFVAPDQRIATFDQDGTLWVEHPIYTQVAFAFARVVALAPQHPEWKTTAPFSAILAGDKAAIAAFSVGDLEKIVIATHTGMSVESFSSIASAWMATAKHPRWNRLYTDLTYAPMLEVMKYLRANGYATYICTGGGQDFVRTYAARTYGVSPEQVIGSAPHLSYAYEKNGQPVLMRDPRLELNNNMSGKAEDIYLFLGGPPRASFGNSTGDQQMLEYTQSGGGARLMMLILHDDAQREYAYGPATGLPDTKVGTFTQALYDEARSRGWQVVSMKDDWKRVFAF